MKIKLLLIISILTVSAFITGCEIEKSYSGPTAPYEVPSSATPLNDTNLSTYSGIYEITSFKKETATECISYISSDDTSIVPFVNCSKQEPFEPLAIKGIVFLNYNTETKSIEVAYKYDMYDKSNLYFTEKNTSNNLYSYVYKDVSIENTFSNFILDSEIINTTNKLLIGKSTTNTLIPNVKLVTDNGSTTYNFVLKKIADTLCPSRVSNCSPCLTDTHTPVNIFNVNQTFKIQAPINLNKTQVEGESVCKYGKVDQTDALGLIGYYEITRMQIFNFDEYTDTITDDKAVYDTNTRTTGVKFKGEFWITSHPVKSLLDQNGGNMINIQSAYKYQIDSDSKLPVGFPLSNTSNPAIKDISMPLQPVSYFILDTFALVAKWENSWNNRTRQVILRRVKERDGQNGSNNIIAK